MSDKPFDSRCTGRIPVPSDPNVPWTPDLLAALFPPERRGAWSEVVALMTCTDEHNINSNSPDVTSL